MTNYDISKEYMANNNQHWQNVSSVPDMKISILQVSTYWIFQNNPEVYSNIIFILQNFYKLRYIEIR